MTSIKLIEGSDAQGPSSDFTIGGWCWDEVISSSSNCVCIAWWYAARAFF
jgi:hypothetical protein